VLGISDQSRACLFDLEGVLTQTAAVHAAAWKEMFDNFLRQWSARHGQPFVPFDPVNEYDNYVDAQAGVQAGRAGHSGWVVGVDRVGQADELREAGADVVVKDLAELLDDA
jgi:beta-phosphoglucomutase-like phosphatase (HAD superfamily)